MRAAIASPLGFLIGLSLGALGGGGAILSVPLLVYGMGLAPVAASTASLLVVGPVALWGAITHWKEGRVRLAAGTVFGFAGLGGSLAGSRLSGSVEPDLLLLLFSALMVVAASATLQRVWIKEDRREIGQTLSRVEMAGRVVLAGTVVGFVTGFFGVGGGFVVVPALVVALEFSLPEAVGTSLVVIAINAGVALLPRIGSVDVPWVVVAPLILAALAGAVLGSRVAGGVEPKKLSVVFVALVLAVSFYTAVRSVAGLA